MKHRNKLLSALGAIVAVGVAGYAATTFAHGNGGDMRGRQCHDSDKADAMRHGGNHGGGMFGMMERYDSNGDGSLGRDEALAVRLDQFKKFDVNNDGILDLTEYRQLWMEAMNKRMVKNFQSHDADGDGKVTPAEFNDKFARMMTSLDRNRDGKIDADDKFRKEHHKD